ncbi:MAG: DUF1127 domain-containing protein [Alphaproteobacteria bacterium]|nr:DUF1127 domain-containing protein [Alphaproteobacteria bacterium]
MIGAIAKAVPKPRHTPWGPAFVRAAGQLVAALVDLKRAAAERSELLSLSDRELRDIGVSRVDAIREARRPLWQWPGH